MIIFFLLYFFFFFILGFFFYIGRLVYLVVSLVVSLVVYLWSTGLDGRRYLGWCLASVLIFTLTKDRLLYPRALLALLSPSTGLLLMSRTLAQNHSRNPTNLHRRRCGV